MKKLLLPVMAIAAITLVGCEKDDPVVEPSQEKLNIINLRSAGKVVEEAKYNLANCKPEGAKETFESFRYVGPLPLYYMDYAADVDWNEFLSDRDNRIARYDTDEENRRKHNLVLNTPPAASNFDGVHVPDSYVTTQRATCSSAVILTTIQIRWSSSSIKTSSRVSIRT